MRNSKGQPQVIAFLAELEEVRALIENSYGMAMDELEQLGKEGELMTQLYDLFFWQAAQKYGIDLPELGFILGRSV